MLARDERAKDVRGIVWLLYDVRACLCDVIRGVVAMSIAWASVCGIKLYSGGL